MSRWLIFKGLSAASVAAVVCSGCCFHKDLTRSPAVQSSGILGQKFSTTRDLELVYDERSEINLLATESVNIFGSSYRRLGLVKANTQLRVNQVARITELFTWMVLPGYYTWDCTLAQIEVGPQAGKEVAVDGNLIQIGDVFATLHGGFLTNAAANSPRAIP